MLRSVWRRWQVPIRAAFLIAALIWAFWAVWQQRVGFASAVGRIGLPAVLTSGALTAAAALAVAVSWRLWLAALGARIPLSQTLRVFLVTQTGKYIPGGLWPFVAQAAAGAAHGLPARAMPLATALVLVSMSTTAVAAVGLALLAGPSWPAGAALTASGLVGSAVLCVPAVLRRLLRGRLVPGPRASGLAVIAQTLLVLTWFGYGVALHLLTGPLPGPGPSLLQSTGIFAAAWVVGMVVIVSPAGAGPREAVLLALLPLPDADALAVALVSRVLGVVADVALAGVVAATVRGPGRAVPDPSARPDV